MTNALEMNVELSELAASFDIPETLYERAIANYMEAVDWLSQEGSPLREYSPTIYPQGSFRLGTMVRPLKEGDEFDVDLVCQLDIAKERTTQTALKKGVGARLRASVEFAKILEEHRRCWRLNYPGDFHLDVLPAIPDVEGPKNSILLADRELRLWQYSNPIGYGEWFFERMRQVFRELQEVLAKSAEVSVEDLPVWRVRTPLQRGIQLLKRHRDVFFKHEDERRPTSIIITTLAAKAYGHERDIQTALTRLVGEMPRYIEHRKGQWWVENPAHEGENFADKWNEDPVRRQSFLQWLRKLEQDISSARVTKSLGERKERLRESFGVPRQVESKTAKSLAVSGLALEYVPPLADASHVERPPWVQQLQYKCTARAKVYKARNRARSLWPLADRSVPKDYALRFEATTSAPRPYEVHWQVVNTGQEAAFEGGLRGDFYKSDSNPGVRWETTKYAGTHWVEAFVVKNGICVARSGRKYVRIRR